jgi:hypothetical protein
MEANFQNAKQLPGKRGQIDEDSMDNPPTSRKRRKSSVGSTGGFATDTDGSPSKKDSEKRKREVSERKKHEKLAALGGSAKSGKGAVKSPKDKKNRSKLDKGKR